MRRGACVVDVEALQRANVYAGSDSTWPIAFHETTHSMRELLTAVGVDSCEAGCMQPAITFIGASVVAQLVASLRLEARLYQSGCERCFAQLSGTSLFLGNSRCPYRASEGGLDIWRASLEEPHNRTVAARRRACSVLHRSTDDGDSRRCSSGFDCAVARSRTIVIGWRSGHYGLSGTSPVHGGRLAILEEDIRAVARRAAALGVRVVLMTESSQHFPGASGDSNGGGGSYTREAYEKLLREEARCMCRPATRRPDPSQADAADATGVGDITAGAESGVLNAEGLVPSLYRRLSHELGLSLYDFYARTLPEHAHHIASSCGHYAARTRHGVRASSLVPLLEKPRPCCDCTHFCYSSRFWERVAIRPLTRLLAQPPQLATPA